MWITSPRILTKTKRRANGKFLPKPILFHLWHPNCYATCPETFRAESQKEKYPFHFQKKLVACKSEKQVTFFFGVRRGFARRWRNDTGVRFSFKPPRARGVPHHLFWKKVRAKFRISHQDQTFTVLEKDCLGASPLGIGFRQEIPRGFEFCQKNYREVIHFANFLCEHSPPVRAGSVHNIFQKSFQQVAVKKLAQYF